MYYTYILLSKSKPRTYVGSTSDIIERIKEHNSGRVKSTKPYIPFVLVYKETFGNLSEARKKELFFKTTTGRRRIREIIENRSTV